MCETLRESMLAMLAPTDRDMDPVGGRVARVELHPGRTPLLDAAPESGACAVGVVTVPEVSGASEDASRCGTDPVVVTATISVYRCGYTMVGRSGARVSGGTLEVMTRTLLDDEWRLRMAVCRSSDILTAAETAPRGLPGGPVCTTVRMGQWTSDEVSGGWYGSWREVYATLAPGWT